MLFLLHFSSSNTCTHTYYYSFMRQSICALISSSVRARWNGILAVAYAADLHSFKITTMSKGNAECYTTCRYYFYWNFQNEVEQNFRFPEELLILALNSNFFLIFPTLIFLLSVIVISLPNYFIHSYLGEEMKVYLLPEL